MRESISSPDEWRDRDRKSVGPAHAAGRAHDPNARASSSSSKIGGWQANPEHTTANDRLSVSAGRFGIVSAKAGGRFCATTLPASKRRTAVFRPSGRVAARYSAVAASSFPTTTTCVCGWKNRATASPYVLGQLRRGQLAISSAKLKTINVGDVIDAL